MLAGNMKTAPLVGATSVTVGAWFTTVMATGAERVTPRRLSGARALSMDAPAATLVQFTGKGGPGGAEPWTSPIFAPSAKNSTWRTNPSLSPTTAWRVMGRPKPMLAPLVGAEIITLGGVLLVLTPPGETPLANQFVGSLPYALSVRRCSDAPGPSAPGGHGIASR